MFSNIWHTVFFDPIYNGLVFFIDVIPGGDVGLAIIAITLLVKVILLPLSFKAARTQLVMRELEPRLKELKEKYGEKKDREKLARETMAAYQEVGINPFASILLLFIQIPIILALYFSVFTGGGVKLPDINVDLLYSFVMIPQLVDMHFLDLVNIAEKSFILAALAGITQYIHTKLMMPPLAKRDPSKPASFGEDMKHSMQLQMRYVMPVIIFFVAYTISAAIALYFLVSNLAAIAQEYVVRKRVPRPSETT